VSIRGEIIAVSISKKKGEKKTNISQGKLKVNFGLENDAHAGVLYRQISLLAIESIKIMEQKGADVSPGDFAENITTQGIVLKDLPVGTKLKIGTDAIVEVTQIGKECHQKCSIYYSVGDCVMPKEGIFAKVLSSGDIQAGDSVEALSISEK